MTRNAFAVLCVTLSCVPEGWFSIYKCALTLELVRFVQILMETVMITRLTRLDKGIWIKGAFAAATMSAVMSCAVTFFLVGMPVKPVENAVNNAISGGISGFISALIATAMYLKAIQK